MINNVYIKYSIKALGLVVFIVVFYNGSLMALSSWVDYRNSEIADMVSNATTDWNSLTSLGDVNDIRPRVVNRKVFGWNSAVVDGFEVLVGGRVIPVQGTHDYQLLGELRTGKIEGAFDAVCLGTEERHDCYMSFIENI